MNIDINIINKTTYKLPSVLRIKKTVSKVLKNKKIDYDVIVEIKIVNMSEIQMLNQKYRKLNQPTDVLSFPLYKKIPLESLVPVLLGDIVICPEMIEDDNFLKMIEHSTLHLLGFHHE